MVKLLFLCAPVVIILPQVLIFVIRGAEYLDKGTIILCDNTINQAPWLQKFGNAAIVIIIWPTILCVPIVTVCMTLLYRHVLRREQRNDRYSFAGNLQRTRSNVMAMQGIFYVLAYLAVETPWIVLAFYQTRGKLIPPRFLWGEALIHLQGFLNAMVYLRPRFTAYLCQRFPRCPFMFPRQRPLSFSGFRESCVAVNKNTEQPTRDDDAEGASSFRSGRPEAPRDYTVTIDGNTGKAATPSREIAADADCT